ncbi:AAA-domain-containing protein [Exidia glandulosa HHB12029]|uniref:AAA-domain-containing protein n=1 Tax=Exidia glandulosa HHB12029 TaxID=1314781 RepID=A0A165EC00_EXIGL|nr:AAA-domain-containing protein [Exidia glandulosa HHB12029]
MRARSAVLSTTRSLASARRAQPRQTARHAARALSSAADQPADDKPQPADAGAAPPPDAPAPEDAAPSKPAPAKPRVPSRVALTLAASASSDKELAGTPMGQNRDILWLPSDSVEVDESTLPPKEIYNEALSHLLITLSARTQRRAAFVSDSNQSLVEPTFALYCPLEGGEYVIDNTVRALARQLDADVVVIDAAQLAAGEWGVFGKDAECIQLPRNPLQHQDATTSFRNNSAAEEEEEDGEEGQPEIPVERPVFFTTQIAVPTLRASTVRRTPPLPRSRLFFDQVVGALRPGERYMLGKPRIVYVRDFGLLASQSSAWMPPLVEAVRERRRTPGAKAMSPVPNPTTIILGMTPGVLSSSSGGSLSSPRTQGALRDLARRMRMMQAPNQVNLVSPEGTPDAGPELDLWGENADADKQRERRNRVRLKRWEDPEFNLIASLPAFSMTPEDPMERSVASSSTMAHNILSRLIAPGAEPPRSQPAADNASRYYRASFIVPRVRSLLLERECRVARRKEVNELLMRMAIGNIGGVLEHLPLPHPPPAIAAPATEVVADTASTEPVTVEAAVDPPAPEPTEELAPILEIKADVEAALTPALPDVETAKEIVAEADMLEEWGHRVEPWSTVKEIADRAMGAVVSADLPRPAVRTLEPIHVPWQAVRDSWRTQRSAHHTRRSWVREAGLPGVDEEADGKTEGPEVGEVDEVVERIKRDQSLNSHEQRLLGCIVDTASMPTSFSQVHLPTHTVDSVRTLVSLPLLHPAAFSSGVLKQHTMTGALLFGPPGTGKTLLVRALARESGARMMIVTPSDVFDMYVGEGEKLVRAVFSMARKLSPCVVFLDEIDSLFGARSSGRGTGSTIAHRGVITEFMQEMDGLKTREDSNVIVIGATNRPFDLDDAVLRRLPRRLLVDLPGEREREEILKIMLRDEILEPDVDLKALAKRAESFSGSDLKHLCVAAALDAVKETVKLPWSTETKLLPAPAPAAASDADVTSSPEADAPVPVTLASSPEQEQTAAAEPVTAAVDGEQAAAAKAEVEVEVKPRRLGARHFAKALREITPSASEAMGTLAELRKWNEEFGENGRAKKRMWGGSFGFLPEQQQQQSAQQPPSESPRI